MNWATIGRSGSVMFVVGCLTCGGPSADASLPGSREERPNIVLLLADDQGWNALSTRMNPDDPGSGSTWYQTPNLDRLAAEGARFYRAYSPGPTCGPTRAAIQFGRSPLSLGVVDARSRPRVDHTDSLANVIKRVHPEYRTAHLGKWHIRADPGSLGFDVHDGPTTNAEGNTKAAGDPKRTFSLSRRGAEFIEQSIQAGSPFFLQISYYADHLRFRALPKTIEKYQKLEDQSTTYQNDPVWAAMNEDLDTGVGVVLQKLRELGIEDETYIIYTSDNGFEDKHDIRPKDQPPEKRGYYKAHPLRSHKYTQSEGGIRVPLLVRGPTIQGGSVIGDNAIGYDFFPTILDWLGAGDALPTNIEGGSLAELLQRPEGASVQRKRPFLPFRYSKARKNLANTSIIEGDFKLLESHSTGKLYLWNLTDDPGEQTNLVEAMPERTAEMHRQMTQYLNDVGFEAPRAP